MTVPEAPEGAVQPLSLTGHPVGREPRVTAIICTRDRPDQIGRAVTSVLASSYDSFDLVIVDQSDGTQTEEVLRPLCNDPRLRYLRSATRGLAAARNVGLRQSSGAIVAFTDDDCVADPDWLKSIVEGFAAYADAQILFGTVSLPPWYRPELGYIPSLYPLRPRLHLDPMSRSNFGLGANFSLRRGLIDRIGYFDEMLGAGAPFKSAEETDLVIRAVSAGNLVLKHPAPVVVHEGGLRSRAAMPPLWYAYGYGTGAAAAKAWKCGNIRAGLGALRWVPPLWAGVAAALAARRHPLGLTQAAYVSYGAVMGILRGLRCPVERAEGGHRFKQTCKSAQPHGLAVR